MHPDRALNPAPWYAMLHCTWRPSALSTAIHGQVNTASLNLTFFPAA